MIPRPAQYLLRFDDLCPKMDRNNWRRFLPLFEEYGLQPILAVIPENRDPGLEHSAPDPDFWNQMRDLQAAGATIGLHGYRHLCANPGRSLLPLQTMSEFAGVPELTQTEWIHSGLTILRRLGLMPRIFVAPRHGFDRNTLRAVYESGITLLSDGFARVPFVRYGLTWIPQQLWRPVGKAEGLWTICLHSNTASDDLLEELREFLREHASQFTSVDRALKELSPSGLTLYERLYETSALLRFRYRQRGNGSSRQATEPVRQNAPNGVV